MHYLLCKHKVADFEKWKEVFQSHYVSPQTSGMHILHILRDAQDPDLVVMWFRVDNLEKARAFTQAPAASDAVRDSGMIGMPKLLWLKEL